MQQYNAKWFGGRNLQSQVMYLTEYLQAQKDLSDWGLRVIDVRSNPPDQTDVGPHQYGDTILVGLTTPYEAYVWTRANSLTNTPHWFNIGQFPLQGPEGKAGDTWPGTESMSTTNESLVYDTTDGLLIKGQTTVVYNTDDGKKYDTFDDVRTVPIVPGKGILIDLNEKGDQLIIKINTEEVASDAATYPKSLSTGIGINAWDAGSGAPVTLKIDTIYQNGARTILMADSNGNVTINKLTANLIGGASSGSDIAVTALYDIVYQPWVEITGSATSGTLTGDQLATLEAIPLMRILYNGRVYSPQTETDADTLEYVSTSGSGDTPTMAAIVITRSSGEWTLKQWALAVVETPSAVGTWVLNESLSGLSTSLIYGVYGSIPYFDGTNYLTHNGYFTISCSDLNGLALVITSSDVSYANVFYTNGNTSASKFASSNSSDYITSTAKPFAFPLQAGILKTSDDGLKLRTFTITGGDDAENPDLIAWLEANATKQS